MTDTTNRSSTRADAARIRAGGPQSWPDEFATLAERQPTASSGI